MTSTAAELQEKLDNALKTLKSKERGKKLPDKQQKKEEPFF